MVAATSAAQTLRTYLTGRYLGAGLVTEGGTATQLGTGMTDEQRPLEDDDQMPSPRDDQAGTDPDEVQPPPLSQQ